MWPPKWGWSEGSVPEIRGTGFGAEGLRFRPQSHNVLPERPSAHPVFSPL